MEGAIGGGRFEDDTPQHAYTCTCSECGWVKTIISTDNLDGEYFKEYHKGGSPKCPNKFFSIEKREIDQKVSLSKYFERNTNGPTKKEFM